MNARRMIRLHLVAALLLAGCASDAPYDTQQMLASLVDEVVLPGYDDFLARTGELESASSTFCADRSEVNLLVARAAWDAARAPWKQAEAHAIGPVYDYPWRVGPIVDSVVRTDNVDAVLAGADTLDEAFLDTVGASHQGMHAVEYLLFAPVDDTAAVLAAFTDVASGDRRCDYLLALTAALDTHAGELVSAWASEGEDYRATVVEAESVASPYATTHEAAADLLNQLIATVEGVYEVRLGDPAGVDTGVPDASMAESPFADRSLEDAEDAIEGAERVYRGAEASEASLGFRSWVLHEDPGADARVSSAFAAARAALAAVTVPLSDAVVSQAAQVSAAIEAIAALSDSLKADVAGTVGIAVEPSLDGD